MKIFIYAIYFPTSKKYYIGQTKNLKDRMPAHLRSGSVICKALWKYDDWQITIMHTCAIREDANRLEIEDIRNFNSVFPNGYNITAGGDGGDNFTNNPNREVIRKKMGKSQQGNRNGEGRKGYKASVETRVNQRLGQLGRRHSEKTKEKISTARKKQIAPFQNRKHTETTKLKMRLSQLKRRAQELQQELK